MLYITDEIIDKIIKEDVPYSDITTEMLGIGEENGTISFYTRREGKAEALHTGWKVSLNTLEYLSGIATLCREMVDIAHSVNQNIILAATRKSMPLSRELVTLAFQAGGVSAHRLGLSETVLIFKQHIEFIGGFDNIERVIICRTA